MHFALLTEKASNRPSGLVLQGPYQAVKGAENTANYRQIPPNTGGGHTVIAVVFSPSAPFNSCYNAPLEI
jgi:hypothetical protein